MNLCDSCGEQVSMQKSYRASSRLLGEVLVPNVFVEQCKECGEIQLDLNAWTLVDQYVTSEEEDAVSKLPIGDFVTTATACEILDISRQAFSKNQRIRNGFLISKDLNGIKLYYRPSVIQFSKDRDGRLNISATTTPRRAQNLTHGFTILDADLSVSDGVFISSDIPGSTAGFNVSTSGGFITIGRGLTLGTDPQSGASRTDEEKWSSSGQAEFRKTDSKGNVSQPKLRLVAGSSGAQTP